MEVLVYIWMDGFYIMKYTYTATIPLLYVYTIHNTFNI